MHMHVDDACEYKQPPALLTRLGVCCRKRARTTIEDFALTYFPYHGLKLPEVNAVKVLYDPSLYPVILHEELACFSVWLHRCMRR